MAEVTRRNALKLLASAGGAAVACSQPAPEQATPPPGAPAPLAGPVLATGKLPRTGSWPTPDPFLFCVHHDDRFPAGNAELGPGAPLDGRRLGQDFSAKDGWNMYHGRVVPGFPAHPHRGFETVTVVRRGLLDHADSLGAAARYGQGDVQWLTAGAGIQHAEMFPLLDRERENPLELFQIWLNLPQRDKMAEPHFKMLWASEIPTFESRDDKGRRTRLSLRAGKLGKLQPPSPPPRSWAAQAENEVAIWTIELEPGATWTLPPAAPGLNRVLYFFRGHDLSIAGQRIDVRHHVALRSDTGVHLGNGDTESELLLLQGRPIGEPVVRRGPFVMNSQAEVRAAYEDYARTAFGGWPWPSDAPVHGQSSERFARGPDGSVERPT